MGGNSRASAVALILVIGLIGPHHQLHAQQKYAADTKPATRARRVTGLVTHRLADADLRRWEKMKSIAFSTDDAGQPWHTTLVQLWRWLEASGHTVYIELKSGQNPNNYLGGAFRMEHFDPRGIRHIAVIRLYLTNIERAVVGTIAARTNGFIPFESLNREERYVEVLGHELAHAVWILSDFQRAAQVREKIEQTNELFISQRHEVGDDPVLLRRLHERDMLIEELELQAQAVEEKIWQEMLVSKRERMQVSKTKDKRKPPYYLAQATHGSPPQQ